MEYGQWRSLVRHFEVCHSDPSFMFFCNGRDCVYSEARPDKVLSHRGYMGCTGDVKVQVLPRVRIPTRVVLPTVVPVVFEPQLMPPRSRTSGSVRAGPRSALRQGTGVAKATVRQGGAVMFCLEEPPRASASGPVTTKAPSTSEPPKTVNTGASAGCLTALTVKSITIITVTGHHQRNEIKVIHLSGVVLKSPAQCILVISPGSSRVSSNPLQTI